MAAGAHLGAVTSSRARSVLLDRRDWSALVINIEGIGR